MSVAADMAKVVVPAALAFVAQECRVEQATLGASVTADAQAANSSALQGVIAGLAVDLEECRGRP